MSKKSLCWLSLEDLASAKVLDYVSLYHFDALLLPKLPKGYRHLLRVVFLHLHYHNNVLIMLLERTAIFFSIYSNQFLRYFELI